MINDRSPSVSAVSTPPAFVAAVAAPALLLRRLLRLVPTCVDVCRLLAPTAVSAAASLAPVSVSWLRWLRWLLAPTAARSAALSPASVSRLCGLLSPTSSVCGRLLLLFCVSPSAVVRSPSAVSASASTSAPFSNIRAVSKASISAESIGTQVVPRTLLCSSFLLSDPVHWFSCKQSGILLGGKRNDAWVLCVDGQIDVEVLLPLRAEVNPDLDDVNSRSHLVFLLGGSCFGLESLQFLDVVVIQEAELDGGSWVIVVILPLIFEGSLWGLIDLERVGSFLLDFNLEVASFLILILMRLVEVRCVIVDLSNRDRPELVPESIEGDEEDTILPILEETDPLLFIRVDVVPVGVKIGPCALVFSLSPGISQLDEPNLLAVVVEIDSVEESIGVALHDSGLTGI